MSDKSEKWIAHIDGANRLYFVKEEPVNPKPTIQDCQYYRSDACDCHRECIYSKTKETN